MTDARFPERWLNDRRFLRLSDSAYRLYVMSLLFSIANRSDGLIEGDDLALMPSVKLDLRYMPGTPPEPVTELEKAGLWRRSRDRWLIVDFANTQTTRDELDVLENVRRRERQKKARQREGQRPPGTSPGQSPGTAQAGRQAGEARTGPHLEEPFTELGEPDTSWADDIYDRER